MALNPGFGEENPRPLEDTRTESISQLNRLSNQNEFVGWMARPLRKHIIELPSHCTI
jgi:hypothetical protein